MAAICDAVTFVLWFTRTLNITHVRLMLGQRLRQTLPQHWLNVPCVLGTNCAPCRNVESTSLTFIHRASHVN